MMVKPGICKRTRKWLNRNGTATDKDELVQESLCDARLKGQPVPGRGDSAPFTRPPRPQAAAAVNCNQNTCTTLTLP